MGLFGFWFFSGASPGEPPHIALLWGSSGASPLGSAFSMSFSLLLLREERERKERVTASQRAQRSPDAPGYSKCRNRCIWPYFGALLELPLALPYLSGPLGSSFSMSLSLITGIIKRRKTAEREGHSQPEEPRGVQTPPQIRRLAPPDLPGGE